MYNALGELGTKKGTLGAGKNQTCDIYVLDDNDNIRCNNDGQPVKMQKQPLNALNIANHLFAMAKIYQASKIDENGKYIGGDAEKIADCKVLDSIQALRDGIKNGENVKKTENKTGIALATAGGTVLAGGVTVGAGTLIGIGTLKGAYSTAVTIGTQTVTGSTTVTAGQAAAAGASGFTAVAAPVVGAVAGGAIGYGIANEIVKKDTAGDFVDEDGNFRAKKATCFKHTAMLGGGISGGLLGLAGTAALLSGPVGLCIGGAVLAAAATVGICALIKKRA